MQMIDVLKRLAELDAQNPNIVKQGVSESLDECGMMGGMSHQPHSPASINMTAATGEELSSMLKDIMTLAGRPMGGEEPMGGADGIAVVDTEPGVELDAEPDMGADEPSIMRSMLDKLNPGDDEDDSTDDVKKVDEYDNEPNPEMSGYGASINPPGNGIDRQKSQHPMAAAKGDNPLEATYESLMADYRKFMAESDDVGEGAKMPKTDPRDNLDSLHPDAPLNRIQGTPLNDKIKQRTGKDYYGLGRKEAGMKPIHQYADRPQLPGESVEDEFGSGESLNDFFSNLRSEVEQGMNVVDTFHDKVDQLPDELPAEVVQFLRDQSAEADGAQDDPEEMKSIMLAAIDKVENALGLKNDKSPDATSESLDILKLAGLR